MFSDCGWEYLQNFVGYSYFRKDASEVDDNEEIFCDDESRLDMMKRVFTGRMIPLLVIFFCLIIPQMISQNMMDSPVNRGLGIVFCCMFVLYLGVFISFAVSYWNYYKSIHR